MDIRKKTREELYTQVWEMPVIKLSKEYNLSGHEFRKWCDKLKVPLPKGGYWSKKRFGHQLEKEILKDMPPEFEETVLKELQKSSIVENCRIR